MNRTRTTTPSNWLSPALWIIALPLLLVEVRAIACSGSQPQVTISDPTNLCANALVMSQEVHQQAAKLGLDPAELAKRVCSAAVLGVQLVEANLPKASGIAGAPSSPDWLPLGLAGAGGIGG